MDIGGWLRELGLGQYEAAFRDNAVDSEILPNLTADDLKEIGVGAVGHRRRLLQAIAALGPSGDSSDPSPAPIAARPAPPSAPTASAERRPITVMFCDLVGSTNLAARLDPEDWRNLVESYIEVASGAVTSFGGHVLKKLGDGLMALFGYPHAQENDGERAVRAALAMQRALKDLNARNAATGAPELSARIGLETGRVVVDHTGEVYGEAPNVAARVQSAAAPGEIWITRAVHRQIAGLFVAEDKGAHELKGVPEKTQLFRIVRVSGGGRRGGSRAPTPLVGRAEELDMLARRWERARRGEGQLVLITGEPGLGKSRLIEEFHARLAETPHTWVEWSSSQLLQNTPLHPAAEWGRARFGGAEVDGAKRLAELESALGSVGLDVAEYSALLAPVVDAPLPPGRAPNLSPEELRSRQLAALTAWLLAGARTQPLMFAFEDLHWADPTSLDVLQALAERGGQAALLILATTRPEFRPPWKLRAHHGVISLAPLDDGEIVKMVGEIATRHALSKDVIAGVSERSGGVPLFVEEVTRLLLERGEHGGAQAIPPTLQQSLAARLDRLGPAREIAQIGAVLGRGFSHALLQAVAGLDEPALRAALEKLADAELLFVEGVAPHANYRFKHALIQDAAYDSLLKSRRQTLHRRAAEVLLASPAPEAEALAHHFTLGGETDQAVEWWGKAGDQALRRSAFAEAISHLGKAIELSDKAGGAKPREAAGAASASERLKLQTSYGQAVMNSKGFAAEETKAAFARAAELQTETGNKDAPLDAYYGRWAHYLWLGELGSARQTAESFLREAERAQRPTETGVGHRILGSTLLWQGDFEQARAHLEQTLRIYDPERDREAKFRLGVDSGDAATSFLAHAAWCLGDVGRARELIDEAVATAAEAAHAPTLAITYNVQAILGILREDSESVWRVAQTVVAVSRKHGLALWLSLGAQQSAWARAKLADRNAGSAEFRQALGDYASQGNKLFLPFYRGLLAEIEAEGQGAEAPLAGIDEALALAGETGEHWFDAGLHRIRGEILLKQNPADPARAEAAFLAAIAVAQQQKARSFELRAALSLAKLYQSTGRPIDAHDILGPALEGFAPTPEFPAIAEAKALLEALAADQTVKAEATRRAQRLKLQTSYGQAVMWSKGFAAEETKAAYARVEEFATETGDGETSFDAYYAGWIRSFFRGEFRSAREKAESFRREAESAKRATEAGFAHRCLGITYLLQGDVAEAQTHLEKTLRMYDPERDGEAKFRLGSDSRVLATSYLALVAWHLGDVARARELMDEAGARAVESAHTPTLANTYHIQATLELIREDAEAARRAADAVVALSREHTLALYLALGAIPSAWARAKLSDRDAGLTDFRQALAGLTSQGVKCTLPFYRGLLAEIEAERGDAEAALAGIDEALALAGETGEHWFDASLHRIRGEVLLKQNPADPAQAEAAFLAAIAIAQQQKARSFELRAALALAKLYQSTGRPVDAHDVLGPALQGFSPTPEFPAIAEAKALFEAVAADETVIAEAARRAQRLKLQTTYGQAVMWSKGYAAEETKAAFARAEELVKDKNDAQARLDAYYGRWGRSLFLGELTMAREAAESFLREAERALKPTEVGVGHRILGFALFVQGDFVQARAHCEKALLSYDPERDREAKFRFGQEPAVAAGSFLVLPVWCLGDVARARALMNEAIARAVEAAHAPTLANAYFFQAVLEIFRDDPDATLRAANTCVEISRKHGLATYIAGGTVTSEWARAKLGVTYAGLAAFREALAEFVSQGNKLNLPIFQGLLAQIEAERGDLDAAIVGLDGALAVAGETGEHRFDAGLHRIRGEILFKHNRADPAPAEAAFLAAIAVARQQKAQSFELRAALSLAKLYQSTGRPIDAHDVLGPALAGFSPTPEFPAIAEAKALFETLEQSDAVKSARASHLRQVQLQLALGNAMIATRGHGAPETTAAFAKARELAAGIDDPSARSSIVYGLWVGCYSRAELGPMRELAAAFLHDAEANPNSAEAGVARRINGVTRWFEGDYVGARAHYERALAMLDRVRDRDLALRFGQDQFVATEILLALVLWPLGEVDEAARLAEAALRHAREGGQVSTLCYLHMWSMALETLRDDPTRLAVHVDALTSLSREHDLRFFAIMANAVGGWLDWRSGGGIGKLRESDNVFRKLGYGINTPALYGSALSETDAGHGDLALSIIDDLIADNARKGQAWLRAEDHRIRGEILLKLNPADPAAEAAFLAAIAVARQQKARSFELLAALSLAKLYQSIGRSIDAHDILGPALAGFSPTPEFPQIAEAKARLEALAADEMVKVDVARRAQRLQLQTSYGQAVMWSKGFAAEETKTALARAGEFATRTDAADGPLETYHTRWIHHLFRGELRSARETAESFLRAAEDAARPAEMAAAHRLLGITLLYKGDFEEARAHCEQTLRIYEPERDREAKFRLGIDSRAAATAYLANAVWHLGEAARARELINEAAARAVESAHVPTLVTVYISQALLEIVRDDAEAARQAAEATVALCRKHGLPTLLASGALRAAWGRAKLGDRDIGSAGFRQALEAFRREGNKVTLPHNLGLLAEIEAERGDAEAALAGIDEALALAGETGEHWFDAGLHRIRGEILLKQNPADPAAAEAAFLAAIAVAQQQKARSFELRAALSLAKLYQSIARPIDAHDVLGPALAGFAPTPEFPQIAEAKALLEALASDDTVKAVAGRRVQRLKLQTSYGQAVMWSKGFAAEETKAALERAGEIATEIGEAESSLDTYYARWARSLFRGEFGSARESAELFLSEAERTARPTEAAVAHRILGSTLLYQGDFVQARAHCEQTLKIYDPERDSEAKFRLGVDSRAPAISQLSIAFWCCGEIDHAREFMDEAVARGLETAHAPTLALVYSYQGVLEILREDADEGRRTAEKCIALCREHSLPVYMGFGSLHYAWARAKLGEPDAGSTDIRQMLADSASRGYKFQRPFFQGLLAKIEAERGDADAALAQVDEALALAGETGEHWFDASLHRIRGEVLLKQNPADPAQAEAAFLAAIAVAQQQKARSFELRAALSLAKLYQSTGRRIDAHDILRQALEGFLPTPEFPTIAEAKALLEALAAGETVKAEAARRAQRLKLQVSLGNALMAARGQGAPQTQAVFERVQALSAGDADIVKRSLAYFGLWVGSYVRGDLGAMRAQADIFRRDIAAHPNPSMEGLANRLCGAAHWLAGDFDAARVNFDRALALFDPARDQDFVFQFSHDFGSSAMIQAALARWPLGETERARRHADEALARLKQVPHAGTAALANTYAAIFELIRGDPVRAAPHAAALATLARVHEMAQWKAYGQYFEGWAEWRAGDKDVGLSTMRGGIAILREQKVVVFAPLMKAIVAEAEVEAGGLAAASSTLDEALAESARTGQHWFDAELHRIRGEILLKHNPTDPAPAEAAFLAAIAVAKQQKARSFELRAALSLAKLYQSTGRPVDADDVLGPALQGFLPTPEFAAIAEAKALFEALAADEAVKSEAGRRAQRLKLQTTYGRALMWSKGYAAEETKAAIARAEELATKIRIAEAPLDTYFGRWVQNLWRGEFGSAREAAESFLSEAEREKRLTEAGVGHRMLGVTLLNEGDFEQAGAHFEQALRIYDSDRDREARFRYSLDSAVVAKACLAIVSWCMGDFARARALMDEAVARAVESAHAPTLANAYYNKGALEILRDDAEAARGAAEVMVALGREHGLALYLTWGALPLAWARAKLGDRDAGSVDFRQALEGYASQGNKLRLPFYRGLLAEIDAEGGDVEAARAGIDGALALAGETGDHWFDAGLHRIRGEILFKHNRADPAPAEAAFLAAIAVARQQKAQSFELRAALSLAKLYQSTGRPAEALDILGPALEGFSPTPEFAEIGEAMEYLAAIEASRECAPRATA